jgi:uncharacterized repeat protein (TIGR01451 family)/LPXTG-motif cell wall-anchored protein
MNALKRIPKRTGAVVAIIAAAIIVPATLFAWGPDRPTYTIEHPADHVTFNSITNNPEIGGDERDFVSIRESGSTGLWQDSVQVQPGKEYTVRMYVHNNAAANLNLVANDVTARFVLPVETGKSIKVDGSITSSNATPNMVYDGATFTGGENFNLAYVANTLKFENNGFPNGTALPESIFDNRGALLGYDKLDGKIPGCFQYDGYVSFKVKPQFASKNNFEMSKQVRKEGETGWKETTNANPGDNVEFLIGYKNTGETNQQNVAVKDVLPTGLSYVAGSSNLRNPTNPNGLKIDDNIIQQSGTNIGGYLPGANAYVTFKAKVAANDTLPKCGNNTLINKAQVIVDGGYKEDDASVVVPKECKPEAKYSCDALNVTKVERTKFKFETKYTAENVTLKKIEYVIRDEQGKEIARQTSADYTQTTVGKYTVEAIVTVTVDGQDKVAPGECKKPFEVVKENTPAIQIEKKVDNVKYKQVGVDQEFTYQIVVTNTGEVDLKDAVVTDKAPNGVTFLKASAGTITNNAWNYTIGSLKVGQATSFTITAKVPSYLAGKIVNTACVDAPQVPGNPDDCDDATVEVPKTPETPCVPGKDAECTKTPETPTELPKTGADSGIAALVGVGSLIAAIGYYIASRRALS